MKKCPFCAEEIQDAAIKCRYCGSPIEPLKPVNSVPSGGSGGAASTGDASSSRETVVQQIGQGNEAHLPGADRLPTSSGTAPQTSVGRLLLVLGSIVAVVLIVVSTIAHFIQATPLQLRQALVAGNYQTAERLLGRGVAVNQKGDSDGLTPLALAAQSGRADFVKLLLQHGADPNWLAGDQGRPPLVYALQSGAVDAVEALIDAGAKPDLRGKDGKTALDWGVDIAKRPEMIWALTKKSDKATRERITAEYRKRGGPWVTSTLMPRRELPTAGAPLVGVEERSYGITKAAYELMFDGASYERVKQLIGKPGEEVSRSYIGDVTTIAYSWKNPDGSNIFAMFQNGKLVSRAQQGLR